MDDTQSKEFIKNERQKTDESLVAEREKTNESLANEKLSVEREVDQMVQKERLAADRATCQSRELADTHSRKKSEASGYVATEEKRLGAEQLSNERDRSDRAVRLERSQVDLATDKERELNDEIAVQLLEDERKRTDKNLSAERAKTDSEVQRTIGLLTDEISEHSKTKYSLTTREEFLAIVSHDLKNPIGVASLGAQMLLDDPTFQALGAEARITVELIKRNIDTSLRLIADLLDMERIEGGKIKLQLEKVCMTQIISEATEAFTPAALAKGIRIQNETTSTSIEVSCDKDRIVQVLSNLIGNALKFTPNGGLIRLGVNQSPSEIQVSICDSGPGIHEEKQDQIFERYAQLGNSDRAGLGLGLYISKMLISAHHGRIWVTSKLGVGSTFYFAIPRSRDGRADPAYGNSSSSPSC